MFVFGRVLDGEFVFNRKDDHIYTWPNEVVAREFFESVENKYHLYQVNSDLSHGVLIQRGTGMDEAPSEIEPTENQKLLLFQSYVYKSLLAWSPPEEML